MITLSNLVDRRAAAGLIAAAVLAFGGAGCAGAEPSGPPAPPATPPPTTASTSGEFCTAVTDFSTAANQLTQLNVAAEGLDGAKAALQNFADAAREVADAAAAEFGPQADELNQAITALGTTIGSLQNQDDFSSKVSAIATSVSGVQQAAAPILDRARTSCPPSSIPPTT